MYIIRAIYADGHTESIKKKWTLQDVQVFIGGYMEVLDSTMPHRALVCDEEGVLKEKPINIEAMRLVHSRYFMSQGLRGNCLLVKW